MIKISKRAKSMSPSATLAMAATASEMKAKGIDVISFATGEPDFDTPERIRNAAKGGLDKGQTRYTPSAGIPELRKAIAEKLLRDNGLAYELNEITVTCGAKQAIYNALQVAIDPGDEVIIPSPYWVSYPDQVMQADGVPVFIKTTVENNFKLTAVELEKAITPKTRAIIINSPSNPSGSAYTARELKALGTVLAGRDIMIISDEIYEKLVYGDFVHTSIAKACPETKDLTVVINGVSKAYAMTGWRMGYAAGPKPVIEKISALVGQQISGIPGFIQTACLEALTGPVDDIIEMKNEFRTRRDAMLELMLAIPGLKCPVPDGAFYLFPDVSAYLGKRAAINTSAKLAKYLLDEARIATVSGDSFGSPENIRFSYATSMKNISEGMSRMSEALKKL